MPPSQLCWPHCLGVGLLLMLGSVVFGCNVFDGVQPEPSSVDALLADARVAMTNGNSERALRLLETAHDRDSTHIGVRIELANAIYASNDLDLFTVRSAVEHVSGTGDSPPNNGIEPVCTGGGDSAPSSRQFEPIMLEEALEEFAAYREQLRRVSRLVVTGGIQRRGEAFSKEPPSARVKGYLLAALTRVSLRLLTIQDEIRDTNTTLYVDVEDALPRAFIACGGTTESIARVERSFCRGAQGIQEAISWLQARNDLIGSDQSSLIIDLLKAHADAMQTRHSCAGATPS